ncbi:ABC transporter permease [Cupriavidus sp. 2TAF22]|uniref:ABC transporter permease n=1 Tax=unclassified Cupriavidus TaxID=2640874 RepID=UPI003F8F119D
MPSIRLRSRFSVAISVWHALFLREANARLATGRAAWLWLLLEPVIHIGFLMLLFGVVRHVLIPGIAASLFIMIGILGFFLVRNVASRGAEAVKANAALFAYRQVRPVDTVLVRTALEGLLYGLVFAVLLAACSLAGVDALPRDPLQVLLAAALLWLLGAGLALSLSVLGTLVPEFGRIVGLFFAPLYFVSAVMYPVASVPRPVRDWLLLNPILHGLEAMRGGFFSAYRGQDFASLSYLAAWSLCSVLCGLALQRRFAARLVAQ